MRPSRPGNRVARDGSWRAGSVSWGIARLAPRSYQRAGRFTSRQRRNVQHSASAPRLANRDAWIRDSAGEGDGTTEHTEITERDEEEESEEGNRARSVGS